jgi:hypothetical protein
MIPDDIEAACGIGTEAVILQVRILVGGRDPQVEGSAGVMTRPERRTLASGKAHLYGRKRRLSKGRDGTRTALYLRVSTADQKPDLQYDGLRSYAGKRVSMSRRITAM